MNELVRTANPTSRGFIAGILMPFSKSAWEAGAGMRTSEVLGRVLLLAVLVSLLLFVWSASQFGDSLLEAAACWAGLLSPLSSGVVLEGWAVPPWLPALVGLTFWALSGWEAREKFSIPERTRCRGTEDHPSQAELRAFVGRAARYYLVKWRTLRDGGGQTADFNWAAFLFPVYWLLFRKMYAEAAVFLALCFGLSITASVLLVESSGYAQAVALMAYLLSNASALALGAVANSLYYRKARRTIAQVRANEHDPNRSCELIGRWGGSNVIAAAIPIVFAVCVNFVLYGL